MSPTRRSRLKRFLSSPSTVNLTTRLLLTVMFVAVICCLLTIRAEAQYGSLAIGQVTSVTAESCPGSGWYPGMTCSSALITGCTTTTPMNFDYGYLPPASGTPKGVIVFFNGKDGTTPSGDATGSASGEWEYIADYLVAGYEVVQIRWSAAWQTRRPFAR